MNSADRNTLPLGFTWISIPANGMLFDVLLAGPAEGIPLVLLHGFPEFADAWIPMAEQFASAGYRCIAIQQRGYSAGARPSHVDDYAPEHLISDVSRITETLGLDRFHLIGHDWGGILAWMFGVQFPQRLLSLVVLSTPHVDAFLEARETDHEQKKMSRYISLFRLPGHVAEFLLLRKDAKRLRAAYAGKLSSNQLEDYVARFSSPEVLTSTINWYRALDTKTRIGPIRTVRTLFIWGDADQALGRTAAERTRGFVQSEYCFRILKSRSHWLLEEAPGECAELCLEFWTQGEEKHCD